MTTVKLTKYMREAIVKSLMKHRFNKDVMELIEAQENLAADVYEDHYPKGIRQKMDALPDGWLVKNDHLSVQFGGSLGYTRLPFNGCHQIINRLSMVSDHGMSPVKRRILWKDNNCCAVQYPVDHPLTERFEKLSNARADLHDEISKAWAAAASAVERSTTLGALLKQWPEIEPFTKKYQAERMQQAVVVQRDHLNGLLNLPVEQGEQANACN